MSKRKNTGRILLFAAIMLGLGMLFGSYSWMQDKSNYILGISVFVLYGIGQWMTILYWQNIQADWESTGEVLGRLQQAVSDIPAALDSNLKSIATRLTEGQVQALSKLQAEVSSGARETLEKGSAMIGESLSKNLASPLEAMKTMLNSFVEKSGEQTSQLQALTQSVREDSRKAVSEGTGLIAASLDKNLRAPLASLETSLSAWQLQAAAQAEASRAFGEDLRKAQREWSEKAQRLAEGLTAEFKALAASTAGAGEASQAAWTGRAAEVQTAWESKVRELQSSLLEDVVAKVESLHASQSGAQNEILARALSGMEGQARIAQDAAAAQAKVLQEAASGQAKAMKDSAAAFEAGLERMRETSQSIVSESAAKVSDLADAMRQGSKDMAELSHVAQINQTEMQAGVAMLNSGLSSILDRLEKQADAGDGYQTLLAELGRTLASFQERAGEVLVENAMKTQEILMEVLNQQEGRGSRSAEGADSASEQNLATVS